MQGLYHCVWQFFGWSMPWEKCWEAIEHVNSFTGDQELECIKTRYLIEFAHYLVEKDGFGLVQQVIDLAEASLKKLPAGNKELELALQREIMVCLVHKQSWQTADKLHDAIYAKIDWTNEREVEQYAYICFSAARVCEEMPMWWGQLLTYANWLQDLADDYDEGTRPIYFNDKVHYYYLHTKLMRVEAVSTSTHLTGLGEYGVQITNALIAEIEANEMISDFSGLLIGAKALRVGTDDDITGTEVAHYFVEAEEYLQSYPDNALLAAKTIDLWHMAYTYEYKKKAPKEYVEKAYALALQLTKEGAVLKAFFQLLKESTEAGNWMLFVKNKGVVDGLLLNKMEEYLFPPEGVHRKKIGVNDLCPCGSGKKFKKCCRGKGIYD